jgi:hypothetical protein
VDGLDFRPLHGEEVEQSRTGHNWGTARGWGSGSVINGQFVGPENADERSGAVCFPEDDSPGIHYRQ